MLKIKKLINMNCPICGKELGIIETVVLGYAERQLRKLHNEKNLCLAKTL